MQVLANRPDIVREDYMNELCILQDDVPAFPNEVISSVIFVTEYILDNRKIWPGLLQQYVDALCWKVWFFGPSFMRQFGVNSQIAFKIIEEEMGVPLEQVFSKISASPIAAASLGQVYRGTLRSTGEEVAIKVSTILVSIIFSEAFHTLSFLSFLLQFLPGPK